MKSRNVLSVLPLQWVSRRNPRRSVDRL